jgi:hypothetical protein
MRKLIGGGLIVISLVCIVSTVIEVGLGNAGLWSPRTLAGYVFHPVTMLVALVLIAPKRRPDMADEEAS